MRAPLRAIPSLLVLWGLAYAPLAAQQARPRVHLIATGGTIASTRGPQQRTGEELAEAVPGLDAIAEVTVEQFSNLGSSSIAPEHWRRLAEHVNELYRTRTDLAGIVITHGTDTMEETAFFLDLTVADARPVVVTGSMRPADAIGADGPANLYNAVRVAASPAAVGRGTLVLMNDGIFPARTVAKSNAVRVDAFATTEGGAAGVADPDAVVFFTPAPRREVAAAFDLARLPDLPRVDVVYSYGGADGVAIEAFMDAGARGVVIASVGQGNVPPAQRAAIARAVERGAVVVLSTRTGAGRVPLDLGSPPSTGQPGRGAVIGAGGLNPQKARVLLMLALARSSSSPEVVEAFRR